MKAPATALQSGEGRSVRNDPRRSERVSVKVPLIVSGLKPYEFSECCETVTVSAHGCQLRSSRPLKPGMQVRLHAIYVNRAADATVTHSEPVGFEQGAKVWNCGLALATAGNIWGVQSPPQDWSTAACSRDEDLAASVPNSGEQPWAAAPEEPRTAPEQTQPDWQQRLSAVEARIAGMEARVEKAAAGLGADVLEQLHLSFGEAIRQARERIKRYTVACGESRLVELEAEVERRLEPFLSRSQTAISDLERLLNSLKQEHGAWETRMAQWQQQYGEQLQSWVAQETQRFHVLAHDAVVEASGQVKGRIDAVIETAREPMERRIQDAHAYLEALALSKADELTQRFEANLQRLHAMQEETERSFRSSLAAQQADALDLFQQQAKDAMLRAVSCMHATLNDALGSTAQALQDQPTASSIPSRRYDDAGSERRTAA